jgi:glycine/D-amino acid oxidase-like deaminating enzyme
MFELAKEHGLEYVQGLVTKVLKENGWVTGVEYRPSGSETTTTIPATHVVLAAGAWSPRIVEDLPIEATRAHSVTIHPQLGDQISPYVLFTEITIPCSKESNRRKTVSPEIYARPGNEVYACGPGDDTPLPTTVDEVTVDPQACEAIIQHVASISKELKNGTVDKRQACFLPTVSTGGGPIIGEAEKIAKGLYLATGHTCWVRVEFS